MPCPCKQAKNPACNLQIDYSTVQGERILPFQISLNLVESVLNPSAGENQRFCYDVVGVGEDTSLYADLSHLVLGICDQIPADEIMNIAVVINGVAQEIDFGDGGNVELRTEENPDPPTGCAGLKFDFPLDKVFGAMRICFELETIYEIGEVDICLFGGNTTAQGLTLCGPVCSKPDGACPAVGYQRSTVCVPVTVTPYAQVGTPITTCCGAPVVTSGGICGRNGGVCSFTISQEICVAVPVEFGARAVAGTPSVQCGEVSNTNICTDCTSPDGLEQKEKGKYRSTPKVF